MAVCLGERFELCLSCPTLYTTEQGQKTMKYFRSIGFKAQECLGDDPVGERVMSDGFLVIRIKPKLFPSPAVSYVTKSLNKSIDLLNQLGIKFVELRDRGDKSRVFGVRFDSPEGLRIMVRQEEEGQGLLMADKDQIPVIFPNVSDYNVSQESALGVFGHLVVLSSVFQSSLEFWLKLGFRAGSIPGSKAEKTLCDGVVPIYLLPVQAKIPPSLVYFSEDSRTRIESLTAEGVDFYHQVDEHNSCTRSPDGLNIFVYSAGGEDGGGGTGGEGQGDESYFTSGDREDSQTPSKRPPLRFLLPLFMMMLVVLVYAHYTLAGALRSSPAARGGGSS